MEQGIHLVDLALALGTIGTDCRKTQPLEDNTFAILRKGDGRVAMLHSSPTECRNLFCLELIGTEAYARAERLRGSCGHEAATLRIRDFKPPFAEERVEYRGPGPCWPLKREAFMTAAEGNGCGVATARDGAQALRTVEVLYASTSTGRGVDIQWYPGPIPAPEAGPY